jgi:hypothetical protein
VTQVERSMFFFSNRLGYLGRCCSAAVTVALLFMSRMLRF